MQHFAKDKQKLFAKLFISPSYFSQMEPPILVSPDFLTLLLDESSRSPRSEQVQLMDQILNIFAQRPTNSLILSQTDHSYRREVGKSILNNLIMRILSLVQTEEEIEVYLQKISLMLAYYQITMRNINKLTQWLSKETHQQKFDPIKLMFIVKLLKVYLGSKLGALGAPDNYFYLLGSENCGIQPLQHANQQMSFKNELSFTIVFNSQGSTARNIQSLDPGYSYNLFYLQTHKLDEIGVSYSQGKIKVTVLSNGKFLDEIAIFQNLSDQIWYRLMINFTATATECQLNEHASKFRPLLKKQKERKIKEVIFGKQFFGMIANTILTAKVWPTDLYDVEELRFGFQNWSSLISLHKTGLPSSVLTSCLPYSIFEVRGYLHCFDIFKRFHSSISDNIYVVNEPIMFENLDNLGSSRIILPLFYLARFYNPIQYPDLLQDLLMMLLEIWKTYDKEGLQKSFEQENFFQILGQHLQDIPHLQTSKTINLLQKLYNLLVKEEIKIIFIRDVLWNLNISMFEEFRTQRCPANPHHSTRRIDPFEDLSRSRKSPLSPKKRNNDLEGEVVRKYYSLMIKIYENERAVAFKAYDFQQISYWMVQNLETSLGILFSCCLQHYINESVLARKLDLNEVSKLHCRKIKQHYSYLEMILANILQSFIIAKKQDQSIEMVKTLLRLLLQKYSACLYLTVLRVIKKQIFKFNGGSQIISILGNEEMDLLSFMVFLSEKTINADIIKEIIHLCLFMAQNHPTVSRREEFIETVIHIFHINKDIANDRTNPISKGAKRIRKNSLIQEIEPHEASFKRHASMSFIPSRKVKYVPSQKEIPISSITDAVKSCPKQQRISICQSTYNLVMNFLGGTVSDLEPKPDVIIYNEKAVLILKEYYSLSCSIYRQKILLYLLFVLEKHPSLRELKSFNLFLLQNLITKTDSLESQYQQTTLIAIYSCIFSHLISQQQNICEYYSSIKCIKPAKVAITGMLPKVVPKVVKLMGLPHLCQMLSICLYEGIETTNSKETIDLGETVILQIHRVVKQQIMEVLNLGSKEDKKIGKFRMIDFPKMIMEEQNREAVKKLKKMDLFNALQREHDEKEEISPTKKPLKFTKILNQIMKNEENERISQSPLFLSTIQPSQQASSSVVTEYEFPDPKIVEVTDLQIKEELRQVIELKKEMSSSSKDSTYRFEKAFQKFQVSLFEIYLSVAHKVLALEGPKSLSTSEIEQETGKSKQSLREDHIAMMELFCVSRGTFGGHELSENQKEITLYNIYYFMYKSMKRESASVSTINLWEFILKYFILQKVEISPVLKREKQNHYSSIFSQIIDKYMKFLQPSQKQLPDLLEQARPLLMELQEELQKIFPPLEDQNDFYIVEKYQNQIQFYIEEYELITLKPAPDSTFKKIQKLFDLQNAAEQKTRVKFLYKSECQFRKYHAEWDRIWTKLRTYHEPYGFWIAQKFKEGVFSYPENQIRNYKFEMSEFVSESGISPVLEAKMVEPWHVVKDIQLKQNKYINSFAEMMKPSQLQNKNKEETTNSFNNFWKGMFRLPKKSNTSEKIREYQAVWVSRSTKALGKLFIQKKQQLIFCYESVRQDDSHIAFQKFTLPYNRQTYQRWSLFKIKKIKVHRYLLKYNALELIMSQGRSLIFNFVNEDKEEFMKDLEKVQRERLMSYSSRLYRMNKINYFNEDFLKLTNTPDPKIVEKWKKRQISNLQYLMYLNGVASRGLYDLSQYYVVPWVAQMKNQKQPKLRDLSKTMGGLGSEERKKILKQKFYTHDSFNPHPPFFFGTHYSSPGAVFNFLIRLSPFTQYCKHLQGGKFDIADRLFCSLVSSWKSATEEVSDVRELIPQFYYLPETLINIDEHHFGITQTGELINNVEIPIWSAFNPYFYISQMRIMMESEDVSKSLNEWIDLIFGYKQKGKEAEENFNVYYYLTYEEYADLDDDEEDIYKKSKESQIAHFGQIPPMIFDKPHPKRNPSSFMSLPQLQFTKKIRLINTLSEKPITLKILQNNELCVVKRQQLQIFSVLSNPAALQKKKKLNIQKSISQAFYLLKKEKCQVRFLGKHYIVVWGYLNNQFRIINKSTGQIEQSDHLNDKITELFINKQETLLLIGQANGLLVIYQIEYGHTQIFIKPIGTEPFPAEISHISEYDGFFSISFGNYVAIYKFDRTLHYVSNTKNFQTCFVKFFRSFSNPLPVKAAFIVSSPLFCVVIVDNANIRTYSINGQFMRNVYSNGANSKMFGRFKDNDLHDVFYSVEEDRVICYSVPDLRSVSILELPEDYEFIGEEYLMLNRNEIWKFQFVGAKEE